MHVCISVTSVTYGQTVETCLSFYQQKATPHGVSHAVCDEHLD